ncbi:Long-chain-fatty-acid--CoA ligase [compost metagenome]
MAIGMKCCDDIGKPLGHLRMEADRTEPSEIFIHTASGKVIATRDLGIQDVDGGFRFRGRIDDLINVSGLKVQPIEVEEVIRGLDGIKEVIVYRGVHPVQGDRVMVKAIAYESLTSQEVQDWCRNHLPEYKVPVEVQFVSEIPRLPSGKISRKLLELEV